MNKSKRDIAHLERSKSYSCASAVTWLPSKCQYGISKTPWTKQKTIPNSSS